MDKESNRLQGWCIINVFQQPVVHPIPLSFPYPSAPRCGTRMHADLQAHQLLPPQGAYLCTNISLSCNACRFAFDTGHVCSVCCMSGQCPRGSSTHLAHAAGAMPEPSAEQPPPPKRGNVDKGHPDPELAKRAPFTQHWKDAQARRRQRTEEPASSSGRAAGTGSPGPNGTGEMTAGGTTVGAGGMHPLTKIGKRATVTTPTVRRMTWMATTRW